LALAPLQVVEQLREYAGKQGSSVEAASPESAGTGASLEPTSEAISESEVIEVVSADDIESEAGPTSELLESCIPPSAGTHILWWGLVPGLHWATKSVEELQATSHVVATVSRSLSAM
jgi:hypothetical protein